MSKFKDSSEKTVHLAVLASAERYLTAIVRADEKAIDNLVLWGIYSSNFKETNRSRQFLLKKIKELSPRWKKEDSPFLNFRVQDVDVDENDAEVLLSRNDKELSIEFRWNGRSWSVTDDNLFGRSGYLSSY